MPENGLKDRVRDDLSSAFDKKLEKWGFFYEDDNIVVRTEIQNQSSTPYTSPPRANVDDRGKRDFLLA